MISIAFRRSSVGDSRANENMGLTSLHTLFLRVHNRLAVSLSTINPLWSDDILYHETRRIVNAIIQHITYNEFLPSLLGASRANFGIYRYDPTVRFFGSSSEGNILDGNEQFLEHHRVFRRSMRRSAMNLRPRPIDSGTH